jgi:hypothetical protein
MPSTRAEVIIVWFRFKHGLPLYGQFSLAIHRYRALNPFCDVAFPSTLHSSKIPYLQGDLSTTLTDFRVAPGMTQLFFKVPRILNFDQAFMDWEIVAHKSCRIWGYLSIKANACPVGLLVRRLHSEPTHYRDSRLQSL